MDILTSVKTVITASMTAVDTGAFTTNTVKACMTTLDILTFITLHNFSVQHELETNVSHGTPDFHYYDHDHCFYDCFRHWNLYYGYSYNFYDNYDNLTISVHNCSVRYEVGTDG
ncbi:hypothetical protein QAD02_022848 [Eretmocerus hayati]|uniref:Uncharacterized protein n=1 Tax=Eretmocerus hayati TaxID=131215 RepID=A0ACC2PTY7_9HYME|nr:hypothetical protein QAD02_022848 [Eretmocerus hayati]